VSAALTGRLRAALAGSAAPVIITGGGGWLGQATLHLLENLLGTGMDRVRVYGSRARSILLRSGAKIPCAELAALARYDGPPPLLLHYACLTKDRLADMGESAFLAGNANIRETVAGLIERRGAAAMFLPSSGAAYAPGPYGEAKRLDEARFAGLAVPRLVIARIFNLAGPFINKTETYAIADFCSRLIAGQDIEIRAENKVFRSYVHIEDLLLLTLGLLLLGPDGEQKFDTAGELAVEMDDLARRAAFLLRPEALIHRASPDGRPDDVYVGDPAALRAIAGGFDLSLRDLNTQILHTAKDLRGAWR
jgi:nucleoside-diphosphate-sugar epimerase